MRHTNLLVLAAAMAACGTADERVYFLRAGNADLPILERGDLASDSLVLFVHGGPGGSGLAYAAAMPEAFDPISARSLLVFYDQRGAGTSQGSVPDEELTLARHVEDLDAVLALLRQRHPAVKHFILLGHSWGGTLTAAWLADEERAARVHGWINVDGATDFPSAMRLSRAWAIEKAAARVEAGDESERWQSELDFYEANPKLLRDNFVRHFANVDALGGTVFDPASTRDSPADAVFFSPYSAGADAYNSVRTLDVMLDELATIDLTGQLARITLPSLFLWGRHDGRVPVAIGDAAFAAVGTPEDAKSMLLFESSGHRPFLEEPAKFSEAVNTFVDTLRR